ncbi:MAG TPA: hypothetical protein VFB54_15530 [Burkholderiales bacterium]|nr:hypothetical protein [Burkholderiales bacterium]
MPVARLPLFAVLLIAVSAVAPAAAARVHHYVVSVNDALTELRVRACFDGAPPLTLVAESLDAASALQEARIEGSHKPLEPNGAELKIGQQKPGTCVLYTAVMLGQGKRHQLAVGPGRRVGPDVITDVGQWLWRPSALADDEDVELRFELPNGIAASAPWRPVRDASGQVSAYRLGHAPYDWPAAVAFGHFAEHEIAVAKARLRVAVLHGSPAPDWDFIRQWLTHAAESVATLYGRFPVDDAQVLVVPGARGNEPVPSAYVLRGGQPALHLFINQRYPLVAFEQDWSAVHEMAHLFLPYVASEDAWLSEGLASYYQHVLRARAGTISPAEAWRLLDTNFRRGMRSTLNLTLAAATEGMHRSGAFMRVYWEGAALMLMADQQLRERTNSRESLDSVLAKLHDCCLAPDGEWHARTLLDKLDQLSGTHVFGELYEMQARETAFPDLQTTYRALGIVSDEASGTLTLLDQASRRSDREAIMTAATMPAQ